MEWRQSLANVMNFMSTVSAARWNAGSLRQLNLQLSFFAVNCFLLFVLKCFHAYIIYLAVRPIAYTTVTAPIGSDIRLECFIESTFPSLQGWSFEGDFSFVVIFISRERDIRTSAVFTVHCSTQN